MRSGLRSPITQSNLRMNHFDTVKESLIIPCPAERAWAVADDPRKLAPHVPMLRGFSAPSGLFSGASVAETHTILGWPQEFRGTVTAYEKGNRWAMTSSPVRWGPVSLPHDVEYSFRSINDGSATEVSIVCDFTCCGLLRLPFGRLLVRFLMKKTLRKLLTFIYSHATRSPIPLQTPRIA